MSFKKIIFLSALAFFGRTFAQCNQSFNLGNDTSICFNDQLSLVINNIYDNYQWHDNSGLSNITVNTPGTYFCTATQIGSSNLVVNGDFELGNALFSTDYTYYPIADVFGPQASYGVISNPNTWFNPFDPCTDHSSGNGNMMVIDGSAFNGGTDAIWCQNINVQAGSKYQFSYWIQSVTGSNILANIQVRINGAIVGTNIAPLGSCVWQQRVLSWTSPISGAVDFCLFDLELSGNGNDFALDDISLVEICEYTDTILVTVAPSDTIQVLEEICPADSLFVGGAWQFNEGTFYDITSTTNCTEFTETTLIFFPVDTIFETQEVCQNDSILIAGQWQSQTGIYFEEIPGLTCPDVRQTSLVVNPLPNADAGNDVVISYEQILTLESNELSSSFGFSWVSMDSIYSTEASFDFVVSEPVQTFYLEITEGNCIGLDTVTVFGLPLNLAIQVPDAFSPNLDGVNDVFRLVNKEEFQEIEMQIYNRWGELIFSGINEESDWAGESKKQKQCPTGVYIYYIEALPFGTADRMIGSGTVTLIR